MRGLTALAALAGPALARRLDSGSRAPLAVAVSGGGDSIALLMAARATGRPLVVLNVDHGLNPDSAAWAARVADLAASVGAQFRALAWSGPKPSNGLPAAARDARHRLLAAAARQAGARVLLLGHTRDDVLEAELMRAQGSTLGRVKEWSPSPVWPDGEGLFLLRPLLGARRAELRTALAEAGRGWIDDPANDDDRFARTLARRRLAGAEVSAPASAEDDADLAALAAVAAADLAGVIRIGRQQLLEATPSAAHAFLAMACVCAGGGERRPRWTSLDALLQRLHGGEAFSAALAGARIDAGSALSIARNSGEFLRRPMAPLELEPGREGVWDGRYALKAQAAGLRVLPLAGHAGRLPRPEQQPLKSIPAAVRPSLPLVINPDGNVSCPILAEPKSVAVRCLVGGRLASACGMFAREDRLSYGSDGEAGAGALC